MPSVWDLCSALAVLFLDMYFKYLDIYMYDLPHFASIYRRFSAMMRLFCP